VSRKVTLQNQFKRDSGNYSDELLRELSDIVGKVARGEALEPKHKAHPLHGDFKGALDLHVRPDIVLIYLLRADEVVLVRLGSHAELFDQPKKTAQAVKAAKKLGFYQIVKVVQHGKRGKQHKLE
jgi:mRNA interferase YafQ